MALKYPFEDENQTPGVVKFTPCDLNGIALDKKGAPVIDLYLPPSIAFSDGAVYEGFEMGVLGASLIDNMNANDNEFTGNTLATAKSQVDQLGQGQNLASGILAKLAKEAKIIAPQEAISGGLRAAPNPNTRVLFKSVALRTFQFAFKMIPTSQLEADQIKKIVKSFRTQLYPVLSGGSDNTSIAYVYPDMYLIEMFLNGLPVEPRVKASFLTAVSTTFNSSSGAILQANGVDPYWSEVDLTFAFGEGVTLDKKDILEGF